MRIFFFSIIAMAGLGLSFSLILTLANRHLSVKEDPQVTKIENILPGLNCAACGFPNCRTLAEAIVSGDAPAGSCPVGGKAVGDAIALALGQEFSEFKKRAAIVHCGAEKSQRSIKAIYSGIETCNAANIVFGGGLECRYGCLGFGDCANICPFNAIEMVNGLPRICYEKCTACGKCIKTCPRGIISLAVFEEKSITFVACKSKDKAVRVKKICPVGCIGCKICQKVTNDIFEVIDNLAQVDYSKADKETNWTAAIEKCPTKTIRKAEL